MKEKQQGDTPDEVVEELRTGDTPVWIEADPDLDTPHGARQHASGSHRKGGASGFFTFIALMLAIAAGGGVYYLWEQQKIIQHVLSKQAQQIDYDAPIQKNASALSDLQRQINSVQEGLDSQAHNYESLRENLSVLEQQQSLLAAQQAQLQEVKPILPEAEAGPAQIPTPSIVDTSSLPEIELANIESLLQFAEDRLKLLQDVNTAIAAMQLADNQLLQLQHPALEPIRTGIENDIAALRQVQIPDLLSLAREIQVLGEQAQSLPLHTVRPRDLNTPAAQPDAQAEPKQEGWRSMLKNVSRDLKPLIAIRRVDQVTPQMLSVEDEALIRQMLQVKLQAASLASLQKNAEAMQYYLQQSIAWLTSRYDMENPEVAAITDRLRSMMQVPLTMELPQTGAALAQLRTLLYPGIAQ